MTIRVARFWTVITLGAVLTGCAVGPNYEHPETAVPATFANAAEEPAADLRQWWTGFNDPMLDSLVTRATEANLDLRLASARVREARASRGATVGDLYPTIDAVGSYAAQRDSINTFGEGGALPSRPRNTEFFEVGFDATWEIDVFGGVRREIEAADGDLAATVEGRRDVLVTLLGDVARNYIELRGRQRQLAITRANLVSQQETLNLTSTRFEAGLVGELDVARARALTETTASQIPALESAVRASMHRLGVLLGREPAALAQELGPEGPIPVGVSAVPVGLPSELLRRRPDIRRAERELAAQTARIGVETADLFPRFSLTGSFGMQSESSDELFDSESNFWRAGPAVRWNLFDGHRIRSNIAVATARQEQALIRYEQTVLNSLEEVENALVSFRNEQQRRVSLAAAVESNRRAVQLANDLYSRGLVDFLNVQESQRSLLVAEDQLVQSETAVSSNLVALYKALGGGWVE